LYATRGWLRNSKGSWHGYGKAVERYGRERADNLYRIIFSGYGEFSLIDTGAYDPGEIFSESVAIAKELNLIHKVEPGSVSCIKALLAGPWDEHFHICGPREETG
jgi:hypothetical protein